MTLRQPNVEALARSLTAKQFIGWETYARLEPFGELRQDYHEARLLLMLWSINRPVNKDGRTTTRDMTVEDFLLEFSEKKDKIPQTFEEQIAIAKIMAMGQAAIHRETKGRDE